MSAVDVASPKNAICISSQRDMANSPAHPLKIYQELHREEHQGKPGNTASETKMLPTWAGIFQVSWKVERADEAAS